MLIAFDHDTASQARNDMLNSLLDVRCRYARILRMRKLCDGAKQSHECKLPWGEHTHQSSAPTPYHAGIRQTSDGVLHDFRGEDLRKGRIGHDNPGIRVVLWYQMLDPLACGITL
jgi:hypothetical protein